MHKTIAFLRVGKLLLSEGPKTDLHFESVNAAKRESRKVQMELDGALGRGSIRILLP